MVTTSSPEELKIRDFQPDEENTRSDTPSNKLEQLPKPDQQLVSRPAPLVWFLVCLGLYLGALLYGEQSKKFSYEAHPKQSQVSTQP
jgi:hypothetical protein